MQVAQSPLIPTRQRVFNSTYFNQWTFNRFIKRAKWLQQFRPIRMAISQANKRPQTRMMFQNRLFDTASKGGSRDRVYRLLTQSFYLQKKPLLLSGYYLQINKAYQSELVLFNKQQIYSIKNNQIQTQIIYLQLENASLKTLYDAITPLSQSIITNMTISMLNAKFLLLFGIGFGLYKT